MLMLANLVWPSLILAERLFAAVPILAGLIVETGYLRFATPLRGFRCVIASVTMNLASALLGIVLVPLSGLGWEVLSALTIGPLFNVGTFNPAGWVASVLLAVIANALVEVRVLRSGFGLTIDRRGFWSLAAVNVVTVAIAYGSILVHPPRL